MAYPLWLLTLAAVMAAAPPDLAAALRRVGYEDGPLVMAGPYIAAVPLTAVQIGLTGSSIGKWIFGVRVLGPDQRPIGVRRALVREVDVCVWGWGVLLPFPVVLAQWRSAVRLLGGRPLWWDALQDTTVWHRRAGGWAWLWAGPALLVVLLLAATAGVYLWLAYTRLLFR